MQLQDLLLRHRGSTVTIHRVIQDSFMLNKGIYNLLICCLVSISFRWKPSGLNITKAYLIFDYLSKFRIDLVYYNYILFNRECFKLNLKILS
jgi:hypothetical protein